MEDRTLLASFLVTTAADNGNNASPIPGSLRQAILSADAVSGPSTIDFNIPSDSIAEFPVPTASSIPAGITTGPAGALWFVERSGNEVARMTTTGVVTAEYTIPTPNSQPILITTGADGDLWFTENAGDKVGQLDPWSMTTSGATTVPADATITTPEGTTYTASSTIPANTLLPAGTITEYNVPTPNSGPSGIAQGPDGAMWFTENVHKLGRIDPVTGAITEFALPAGSLNVGGLTTGPDGNLWYADLSGVIGRVTPAGVVTTFATSISNSQPYTVTVGPDGALWFPERTGKIGRITPSDATTTADSVVPSDAVTYTTTGVVYAAGSTIPAGTFLPAGTITEYTIPTAGSAPTDLTVGADGALWFPEGIAEIGRLTPDGTFTQIAVPTSNSAPAAIAAGPDGHIWFTEYLGDQIGQVGGPPTIVPTAPLPAITQPVTIDGTSQPGYAGTPVVVLDGAAAGPGAAGLTLNAVGGTVQGLVINNFQGGEIVLTSGGGDTIQGNYIGTDPGGTLAAGGFSTGISIASPDNLIGGTGPGEGNLISGNGDGVDLLGSDVRIVGNLIEGNRVGTNATGTAPLGNRGYGVYLEGTGTMGNSIGGPSTGGGNLISGNGEGIGIYYGASGNAVQDNFIGSDVTGTAPLGNYDGIVIVDAGGNFIGGPLLAGNLISGNNRDGIILSVSATGNDVLGNLIGTDATGANPLGNAASGIWIVNGAQWNIIGLMIAGTGNTIAFNNPSGSPGSGGVVVQGSTTVVNAIRGNSIYDNGGLGIDLGGDGVTLNGSHTGQGGPNDWQTFPIVTSVTSSGGTTIVSGDLSGAASTTFAPDFYVNAASDPTGFGQGQTFLGALNNVTTDSAGIAAFTATFPVSVPAGQFVSATATYLVTGDLSTGETSEFSPSIGVNTSQVTMSVNPSTIGTALQDAVGALQSLAVSLTTPLPSINLAVNPTTLSAVVSAVDGLAPDAASPANPVPIVLSLAPGTYSDTVVTAPAGVQVTINGGGGAVVVGNSPAFELDSGSVLLEDLTFSTATDSPTILVTGGSLTVRDCTIQESTGSAQAAILITGGSVDLGTASSPGGNTVDVNGTGELVHDSASSSVPDIGNTLEVDGTPLASPDLSFTALTGPTASSAYGQPVTLTATVRAANLADGTPSGSVDFVDTTTGTGLGTAPVTNGVATLIMQSLTVGSHTITADYEGDSQFAFSLDTTTESVHQDATNTVLAASAPSPLLDQAETFMATVSPVLPGNGTPTGTVTFYDGNTALGTASLTTSGGFTAATLTTSALAVGSHSITADYGGDQDFVGGVSRNISTPVGGLSGATAVAVDAQGDLFISAISGNDGSIREVRPDGSIAFYRGGGATALAVDAKGDLFFTANDSLVNEVEPGPDGLLSDGTTVTIAGGGPNSNSNLTGPATAANLDAPAGLALDARGDLYITDLYNRVLEVTPGPDGLLSDGAIATIAGLGDPLGSTGRPGFGAYCGDGGPAISASLWQPSRLAMNAQGDLIIADSGNNVIRELTPGPDGLLSDGIITTVAGTGTPGYSGDGGQATAAMLMLGYPSGMAVDSAGDLFIANTNVNNSSQNVIREVTPDGTITTIAGGGANQGDGGPATAAILYPNGIASDTQGNLFVADGNGVRELGGLVVTVRAVTSTTTSMVVTPDRPVFGQPVTLTATVATANPSMGYPGMVYPTGTVTFYDGSTELGTASLATAGAVTTASLTIPPPPIGIYEISAVYSGDANFTGSDSTSIATVSETPIPTGSAPWGIASGPDGALWFTENGLSEIGRYDPATGQITQYATPTAASAPVGITVGPDGAIWFAEYNPDQIGRLDPATGQITEYGGLPSGSATQQIASGPLDSVWFTEQSTNLVGRINVATGQITEYPIPTPDSQPAGITEGPDGAVWFTEYGAGQIGRLDPSTGQITEYPIPTPGSGPVQITTGPDGALWFTESGANQIGRIDPTTDQITEYAGAGVAPWGIVTGPDGGLWFSEIAGAAVGRIDPTSGQITEYTGQTSSMGITVGPDGHIWFVENARDRLGQVSPYTVVTVGQDSTTTAIVATSTSPIAGQSVTFTATVTVDAPGAGTPTGTVTFYDGSTELGATSLAISGGIGTATFSTAALAVGLDSLRAVYSGDSNFTTSTSQVVSRVAGDVVAGYSGDGGPATAAMLNQPTGVAVDSAGDLFIVDGNNDVIREVRPNGTITTVAGDGTAGYSGDGGPATAATLDLGSYWNWYGSGLAVDAAGDLFIADTFNNVIREVRPDGIITTVAGNGVAGYSGDGGLATDATLNYPTDVSVDSAGDLFIADTLNNVIREVRPDGIITTVAGDGTAGYNGDGGPATDTTINNPTGVAVDGVGDLFIADFGNSAVRKVGPDGIISNVAAGDYDPTFLAVDTQGDLYFTDYANNWLWMRSSDGTISRVVLPLGAPSGVAVDDAGDVFTAAVYGSQIHEIGGLLLDVQPLTAANLQTTLSNSQQGGTGGFVTLQTTSSSDVSAAVQAISGLTNPDPANPETVTLDLAGATTTLASPIAVPSGVQLELTSSSGNATVQGVTVGGGTVVIDASVAPVDWTVDGGNVTVEGSANAGDFIVNGGTVTLADGTVITGNSPAIILNSGTVILQGATAQTATNSPTIVVNGGSLIIRDSTIEESTGYNQAAILVNAGTVNLGTVTGPGGNILNVNGSGEFLEDSSSTPVSDSGNTLEVNGTALAATDLSVTTLTSSAASTTYGQSVTLSVTVGAADPADGTPAGSVDFVDTTTGVDLGTVALSGGVARLATTALGAGTHAISASYLGNSSFAISLDSLNQTVTPAALTITAGSASKVYGAPLPTLSATFAGLVNGDTPSSLSTPPTLGTAATATSPVGSYTIRVGGAADPNYSISYVNSTLAINPDPTTTVVTASASTASLGQTVTFQAIVTANAPGSGTPAGTVDFFDMTTRTDLTPGGVALSSGTASFSTTGLSPGSHLIEATYSGSTDFLSSSGTAGTFTIGQTIFVLDPSAGGALSLSGGASINIAGGVYVDSSSSSALSTSGAPSIKASIIDVHGGVQKSGSASFSPAPITGAAVVADPLASLPLPSTSGLTRCGSEKLAGASSATIQPGIYSAISVSGSASLTLSSGTYIIEGGGFSVSGAARVTGSGVLIVNAGSDYPSTGGTYGSITLSGSGSYKLTPPTTGTYAGIVIFQTRDNSKAMTVSGAASGMTGTVYAPAASLTISGSGQLNAALVVDTLTLSGAAVANAMTLNAPSGTVAYTPAQVRAAYGVSSLALDGTGQTIAIVDAYDDPSIFQALDAFDTQFGLTGSGPSLYAQYGPASSFLTVLNQYGQATSLPSTDPSGPGVANWEVEEALDVEWGPRHRAGAQIVLVEADSQSLSDLIASVATAASQPGVSVVSMSWGFPEGQSVFAADEARYDSVFNVPGVTFVASTGDYGAADPEYPAFSPNVVAVGGTSLTLNADDSYYSETGWGYDSSSAGAFIGSGGGISLYEPEPAYQQGVQSTGYRTTPDVSMVADPATGAWIADPYNLDPSDPFEVVGGTSLSAPAWAGLVALVDKGRVAAGESVLNSSGPNETQQALYSLPQADYNVITSGTNGYAANAGYNLVTGLGTPVANRLVPDLVAYQGPATSYAGPTVGPLEDATLSGPVTAGGGEMDVFSVFDSWTVRSNGLGNDLPLGTGTNASWSVMPATGAPGPSPTNPVTASAVGSTIGAVGAASAPTDFAAGSPSVASPAGVVPLPSASGQWSVVSGQWAADGGPTDSQLGPESMLVIQAMNPEDGRGRVIRIRSEATDPTVALDLLEPAGKPSARPTADPRTGPEPRAIPDGTDRIDRPAAIPIGLRADRAIDAALHDLDSGAGPMLAGEGVAGALVVVARVRREGTMPRPDPRHEAASWPSRLAMILLAAGWFGQGAGRQRGRAANNQKRFTTEAQRSQRRIL